MAFFVVLAGLSVFASGVKADTVNTSSITVLSPNGGESWTKGTTQTIKWQDNTPTPLCLEGAACAAPVPKQYDIKLATYYPPCTGTICPAYPYKSPYVIANDVYGSSYSWSVGKVLNNYIDSIAPDDAYTIQICQTGTTICDSSDSYFKIVSGTSANTSPVINASPAIPTNLSVGQSITLGWGATDADGDDLSWSVSWGDGTGVNTTCPAIPISATTSPNPQNKQGWTFNASHAWVISGTYTVKATASDCRGGSNFHTLSIVVGVSITPVPSITVLSPNGGERLEKGKTYNITWNSTGYDKVRVFGECENYGILGPILDVPSGATGGSYSYTVPAHLADQSQCKVQVAENSSMITNIQNGINSDYSDAPFSVVAAGSVIEVLKADLQVNNSDSPQAIPYGSKFTASWISSGASYCTGYGTDVISEDGGVWTTGKYPASGSKTLYAKSASGSVPFSVFHLGLQCWDDFGKSTMDLIGNISVAFQTTGTVSIKDGSVVKIQGAPDVYFIKEGQKVKINSPKEFEEKGYKWDQIQTVQSDLLAQIVELKAQVKQLREDLAKAGALLKSMTGNDIYVIKDGKKEKIQDPETFNKRGYKWDQIKSVSQEDLESIPEYATSVQQPTTAPALPQGITSGSLVKSPNSPTVYFITPTGAKKPILNIKVFNSYNSKWDNVKTVSQDEISSSPTVNAIRIGNDPKVYFISNGQKQWVKTPEAFAKQGLKWDQIVSVNKTEFDEYKEGEEIK